jgi:hypothetical protein
MNPRAHGTGRSGWGGTSDMEYSNGISVHGMVLSNCARSGSHECVCLLRKPSLSLMDASDKSSIRRLGASRASGSASVLEVRVCRMIYLYGYVRVVAALQVAPDVRIRPCNPLGKRSRGARHTTRTRLLYANTSWDRSRTDMIGLYAHNH